MADLRAEAVERMATAAICLNCDAEAALTALLSLLAERGIQMVDTTKLPQIAQRAFDLWQSEPMGPGAEDDIPQMVNAIKAALSASPDPMEAGGGE